ncbi:caspase family protein [Streptomyces sp. NPDC001492]
MGRRLALLIATYDYQDTGLRQLTAPAHDAEALAAVLQDPKIAGFEVTTLINKPHYQVGEAISDLYRNRRSDDLTLLYFTGHGLKDEDGRLYLAMVNTRRESLLFTSLPAEQVDQAMSGCMSRQKVLILDCCYSGAFPAGNNAKADTDVHALERFQGRGRSVLTASDATQYSFEGNQPHGEAAQSVFTRHLVAGLRDGSADLDGDGNITIDELYRYVHDRVVDETPQQRPKRLDNVEGRIVIARNNNWTLPAHLRNALGSPIAADRLSALDGLAYLYQIGNDIVRQRVADELQRLADDDSRNVSAAAAAKLQAIHPGAPEPSRTAPEPVPKLAFTSPAEPTSEVQATPPSVATGTAPSKGEKRSAQPDEELTAAPLEPGEHVAGRTATVLAASVSGLFLILSAALLITGIIQEGHSDGYFTHGDPPWSRDWYVITMAAVALAAAICMLLPRTRFLIGPGVVLGTAAASVWGLVYFYLAKDEYSRLPMGFIRNSAYQLEYAGHVTLMVGACLAGLVLRRSRAVRIELWRPTSPLTWSVATLAGASAVAGALLLHHEGSKLNGYTIGLCYTAAAALAVGLPVCAAALAPRRFGLSLLFGWVGGAFAIALYVYEEAPWNERPYLNMIAFACTLLVLTAAGVAMDRSSAK